MNIDKLRDGAIAWRSRPWWRWAHPVWVVKLAWRQAAILIGRRRKAICPPHRRAVVVIGDQRITEGPCVFCGKKV